LSFLREGERKMATPTQSLAEVYVLRKMQKKRMEEMKQRDEIVAKDIATNGDQSHCTSYDESNNGIENGCFSWIHKKIHPSSSSSIKKG